MKVIMSLSTNGLYRFDEFELDSSQRLLSRNEEPIPLISKAFDVLPFHVLIPGRVVTKEEQLKAVWPDLPEANLLKSMQPTGWGARGLGLVRGVEGAAVLNNANQKSLSQNSIQIAIKRQGTTSVVPIEANVEIGLQPLRAFVFNRFDTAGTNRLRKNAMRRETGGLPPSKANRINTGFSHGGTLSANFT